MTRPLAMVSLTPTATIALISATVCILTLLGIATLAYIRNRLQCNPSRRSKSYTFYQYDPNPKYTMATQTRMSLLVVSPSCPVMVSLPSDQETGVRMMQVMITPPTPVKRTTIVGNSI